MIEQLTPSTCPHCGKPVTRVICGASGYFSERDKLAVESGAAILGGEWDSGQPAWVCLQCVPAWGEVHRLAWQDYEWQVAKEQAVEATDYYLAAEYRDRQYSIRESLRAQVATLIGDGPRGPGGRRTPRCS